MSILRIEIDNHLFVSQPYLPVQALNQMETIVSAIVMMKEDLLIFTIAVIIAMTMIEISCMVKYVIDVSRTLCNRWHSKNSEHERVDYFMLGIVR